MIASLVVVIMILGCPALLYFKGTFVKAFAAIVITIVSGMVAFGFFEAVANMIISRAESGTMLSLAPWAQTTCFILIFVVVFALLQTGATYLLRNPVDLGFLPECIGRIACGIVLGFLLSGFLLTALAMGPLPLEYPYQRFDPQSVKPDDPKGALFGADGFATGLFSMISKGSFSGKRSFATVHPDYLDQLFFNRLIKTDSMSLISLKSPAITVPGKAAVWDAPQAVADQAGAMINELKSTRRIKYGQNQFLSLPVSTESGNIKIVRVGVKKLAIRGDDKVNGAAFTPSQLRLICKRMGSGQDSLSGEAINVYPLGHLRTPSQIQVAQEVRLTSQDFDQNSNERYVDFVFNVPSQHEPMLVECKMNSIVEILPNAIVTDPAKIPQPATFDAPSSSGGGGGGGGGNRPRPERPQTQNSPNRRPGLSDTSESILGPEFGEE